MTTTAYDGTFIVSDSFFTDKDGVCDCLEGQYKVRVIGDIVIGMAGSLFSHNNLSDEIALLYEAKAANPEWVFSVPEEFNQYLDGDIQLIIYHRGKCQLVTGINGILSVKDITGIPTLIGSGKDYIRKIPDEDSNSFYCVSEGIERDPNSGGELRYVYLDSVRTNNLMSATSKENIPFYHTATNKLEKKMEGNIKEYQGILKSGESVEEACARGVYPPPLVLPENEQSPWYKYTHGIPLTEIEYKVLTEYLRAKEEIRRTNEFLKENPGISAP